MLFRIRRMFMDPFKKIHPFGLLAMCRGECPHHLRAFGFDFKDEGHKLLFGIVHIWLLHRRMHKAGMDKEKMLLWDYLWSYMKTLLCLQEIHELDFRANLEEMQHKTLGFCLALDESLDEYQLKGDLLVFKKMMVVYFHKSNYEMLQSQEVEKMVKYIIAQLDFVERVPEREFRYASFMWPELDHYVSCK